MKFIDNPAYIIVAEDKAGQINSVDYDTHSGGYPYWSTSSQNIYLSLETVNKTIVNIKKHFKSKSGEYFDKNIKAATLELIEIGIQTRTSFEDIDISEETIKLNKIKSNIGANDFAFLEEYFKNNGDK